MGWQDAPLVDAAPSSGGSWKDAPLTGAAPRAAPAAAPADEPSLLGRAAGGATEPLLSLATGAVAAPLSGLAGLAGAVLPGPPGQGADWTRNVGSALTYQPKSQGGRDAMEVISYPFQKLAEAADAAGGKVSDVTGSPALGAGVNTAIQAVPMLAGAKGAGKLKDVPDVLPKVLPEVRPEAADLVRRGAPLTPGQMFGGGWDRAEQAAANFPLVGAPIRGARRRAFEGFNKAVADDALEPVATALPPGKQGHDAVAWVNDHLGDRYDDILARTTGRLDGAPAPPGTAMTAPGQIAPPPATGPSLRADLENLRQMMDASHLPKKYKGEFGRILDEDIIGKFGSGTADGLTIKDIDSNLRVLAQKKGLSDNRDVNTLGLAVREARNALKSMVERENPTLAPELKATDAAYARFKILQKATVYAGKDGLFTPAQLERAVKANDKTKDKRAYSEGQANMQDLAKSAREALGDSVPDSGTPWRLLLYHILGSAKTLGASAAGATALALPYSRAGTAAIRGALVDPPAAGVAAARGVPIGASEYANQLDSPP